MKNRLVLASALLVLSAFLVGGCATTFTGDAHITGGAPACETKCKGWGLELAGMVAMGEYSDACICRRPGEKTAALDGAVSAAGATAGVVMQMRRAEEQRQQATMVH